MNEREFSELAAGHALGALSADDERDFQAALDEHPEWASLVDVDLAVVARLAASVPEVAPPPTLKQAILARVDELILSSDAPGPSHVAPTHSIQPPASGTPPQSRRDARALRTEPAPRRAGRRARTWFALAASIALLLGIGAGATVLVQSLTRPAAVVALERIEGAADAQRATAEITGGGEATLNWSESLGEAVLVSDGLPALESGETFQLWYVRGETPISAGLFDPAGESATELLQSGIRPGDAVAVSIEQDGGSTTGAPTSDPIVIIPTA